MFDHTLTSLLQIVVVVDLLGAAAYFVLAGMRRSRRRGLPSESRPSAARMGQEPWDRLWGPQQQPQPAVASDGDYGQLRSMLDSYRDGLR